MERINKYLAWLFSFYSLSFIAFMLGFIAFMQDETSVATFAIVLAIYLRMIADKHDMGLALKKLKDAGFESVLITPLDNDKEKPPKQGA